MKFALPDSKKSVVLDVGNRIHLTEFERPLAPAPSNFCTKLRKHLRSKRLTQLKQVGNDRVLVFEFADGLFYLVFEFFSAGNVLLLDHEQKILSLLRMVTDLGPENDTYAVNETYKVFDKSLFDASPVDEVAQSVTPQEVETWVDAQKSKLQSSVEGKKKKKVFSIHKLAFVNVSHLSSDLILKTLVENNVNPHQSCLEADQAICENVAKALNDTRKKYDQLLEAALKGKTEGFIVEKKNSLYNAEDKDSLEFVFDEFHPFEPYKENLDAFRFQKRQGYNDTLDHFFLTIESTKYALRAEQQKQHAQKRLDKAVNEKDMQIERLRLQQESNEHKGNMIIYHAEAVERCKSYIQEMIKKQTDWTDIENIIKFDASRGNQDAKLIRTPLNLKENKIKLQLIDLDALDVDEVEDSANSNSQDDSSQSSESDSESDSESESDSDYDSDSERTPKLQKKKEQTTSLPTLNVDIDLALSAYANARVYFDTKKVAVTKEEKVQKSSEMALRNVEKRIQRDLSRSLKNETDSLKAIRPKFWFEKYFWFVTSDGYLCLAGRDDLQTDMIYYRHFSDDDYYVSADIDGALKVFILNPYKGENLSPTSLFQAGIFALLTSSAWNGKVSSSAWWLSGHDISKLDFDGSILGPGRLNYKGPQQYMPPAQLVMGFGLYWLCDEKTASDNEASRTAKQEEHGLKISFSNKKKDLDGMNLTFDTEAYSKSANHAEVDVESQRGDKNDEEAPSDTGEDTDEVAKSKEDGQPGSTSRGVRGKKGKLKKISKYADQDEEEKRLRMEALGTLKQVEDRKKQEEEMKRKEEEEKALKYAQRSRQRQKSQESRELQRYLQNEDNDDGSSDTNYLQLLDQLLAKPTSAASVVGLVPVFAPWSALSKFKYKVKFQPGLGKKGKSMSDAVSYFGNRKMDTDSEDLDLDWPVEHEFLKSTKADELIRVFTVNKVKLVLPGGAADNKSGKKGKKPGKR